MSHISRTILVVLATALLTSGCEWTKQDTGIAAGAVVGGVAGSALTGGSAAGAVGGAAVGGLVGNQLAK
ncbi:MAG: glycine zipper 2TM domain-containing protein [Gammaproteobacteria bacterium]|nr:glycine zipper 2TM domain-containing protein [Gammaproteobacteria bacterium]